MLGSDGWVYNTQCPTVGAWVAEETRPPSIQRSSPEGKVEIVATEVDGITLRAPNDLSFGPDGRLYFTDSGDWDPVNKPDPGYVFALNEDGTGEVVMDLGPVYPNGVVCEPDGSVVWVESYTLRVRRRRPDGKDELVFQLPDAHIPDGLKIDVDGNLWITTFSSGGIDVIGRDGTYVDVLETGGVPLNCVFAPGGVLYVCDFGTADTSGANFNGRLLKLDVGVEGMPLFRGAIR
jgi:gluconolactonase